MMDQSATTPEPPAPTSVGGVFSGRTGLSEEMIGRADALADLAELIDCALTCPSDATAIALISGEAGVGKTRLVREALDRSGLPVLLGASAESSEVAVPYAFVRRMLGPTGTVSSVDEAYAALAERVVASPGVVVVDDLHWIDAESMAAVDRLTELPRGDLVILITYRPEDLHRRLPGGEFLLRLERRRSVERINLSRFNRAETAGFLHRLFGHAATTAVIEAVHERTGGNPFVIEELAASCGSGATMADELVQAGMPWSLEEIVKGRLDGLTTVERSVIETAAVCGPSSSFDLLAAVAGLSEDDLVAALRALVARDLLVESSDDRFAFRHALVRDAVAGQLLGRERRRLHARALDALGDSCDLAARARHAEGAGRFDEFVDLARAAAAEALARGSSFAALRLADDALTEAPDDPTLLGIAAEASWLVGADEETEAIATRWIQSAHAAGDISGEADATRWLARAAFERGDHERQETLTRRIAQLAETLPAGLARARAMVAVTQNHMLLGHGDETRAWGERVMAEATALGAIAEPIRIQAAVELASVPDDAGCMAADDEGRSALLAALDEAEAAGLWSLAARAANNLFESYPVHSAEAIALVERYARLAATAGYDSVTSSVVGMRRAAIHYGVGDQQSFRRALASASQWVSPTAHTSQWLVHLQGMLALEEGCVERARDRLDQLRRIARHERSVFSLDLRVKAATGVTSGSAAADLAGVLPGTKHLTLPDVVEAALAGLDLGHPPGDIADELAPTIALMGSFAERAALHVSALCAKSDDPARAAELLAPLVADPDPWLPVHLVGELRLRRAEALAAAGDRRGALAEVERVIKGEFARWPGVRRDRAEALRRRLSGPVPVAPDAAGELTLREREVAMLLAEGLSNGQLARRLAISPKTAAVHVSNILAKLQMANRAEVAAWAVRTGLARTAA